jgi:acyl-CoA reductase-like NAD-dependent aldehyde dehydrogenase
VEAACGIAPYLMGETLESVAGGIDCYSIRQPLGVVAGICPFNFPVSGPHLAPCCTAACATLMEHMIWPARHLLGPAPVHDELTLQ